MKTENGDEIELAVERALRAVHGEARELRRERERLLERLGKAEAMARAVDLVLRALERDVAGRMPVAGALSVKLDVDVLGLVSAARRAHDEFQGAP